MRIATWNVNSLKARLEKVVWWLERARPDVLLVQETETMKGIEYQRPAFPATWIREQGKGRKCNGFAARERQEA